MRRIKKRNILIFVVVMQHVLFWFYNLPRWDADYIIVTPASDMIDSMYVLDRDERTKVELVGKDPVYEVSYVFFKHGRNKFRVYGYEDKVLSKEFDCLVWHADNWEILAPIKRDYDKLDWENRLEHRYFANRFAFDEYDRKSEDYIPVLKDDICIEGYEFHHMLKQEGYYLITARKIDDSITWFLCYGEEAELPIQILGNSPEKFFNETIINSVHEDDKRERRSNYFVVKGKKLTRFELDVESWKLCKPFYYYPEDSSYELRYGFTEDDIKNGVISGTELKN